MQKNYEKKSADLIKTGLPAFDNVLGGGLTANRVYLLHGTPGSGKTTLALQFLLQGVAEGEDVLYVTLSETKNELSAVARSHGLKLDGMQIVELVATEDELQTDNQYTMYQPSDIELNVTTKSILDAIDTIKPKRVVIDSLSEVKLLAQNALRFRRQVLALKQFFTGRDCTVLFLDDNTTSGGEEDMQLASIAHGVISLEQLSPEYGSERRRLRITKLRGQRYRGGYHDFTIGYGGLNIFPRIIAAEHSQQLTPTVIKSGISQMDEILGGGLDTGTSALLLGPAGSGKSSLALQYAANAAKEGKHTAYFTFDERVDVMVKRAKGLGIPLQQYMDEGLITVRPIDPAELSPGEFADLVRDAVDGGEETSAKIIVIDSLNGYMNAMPEERYLTAQLHELLTYLGHMQVVTFLVVAQHGLLGNAMQTPLDTSYLADTVILFRYFEAVGEVKQLISVVKKRTGNHQRTIREYKMDDQGIHVGEPLHQFQGLLTGTPHFTGGSTYLIKSNEK